MFASHRIRRHARLLVRALEGRIVPTQFIVTSSADSGIGSLRAILASANTNGQADTITFDPSVTTINLTTGQLAISEKYNLTIDGGGTVTINGATNIRVFSITAAGAPTVTIKSLTIAKGNVSVPGGAIILGAQVLVLTNVSLLNNTATDSGGGIYSSEQYDFARFLPHRRQYCHGLR
jgi:predicted outer membrane repeat protein